MRDCQSIYNHQTFHALSPRGSTTATEPPQPTAEYREQLRKHIAAIDGRRPQDGHITDGPYRASGFFASVIVIWRRAVTRHHGEVCTLEENAVIDAQIARDSELFYAGMQHEAKHKIIQSGSAPEATAEGCKWTEDSSGEYWESACGETWTFLDGGPSENNARFCHGCGKTITAVAYIESIDEEDSPLPSTPQIAPTEKK